MDAEGIKSGIETASAIGATVAPVAEVAATAIGHPEIAIIIRLLDKYGPNVVEAILRLFEKKDVTTADVRQAFSGLKPYSAYGIPDKVPAS